MAKGNELQKQEETARNLIEHHRPQLENQYSADGPESGDSGLLKQGHEASKRAAKKLAKPFAATAAQSQFGTVF
jgi:hypothetical protein